MVRTRQDGAWLSPSSAGGQCYRRRVIEGVEPYYLDPGTLWTAFCGTAIHNSLEDSDNDRHEVKLSMPLDVVLPDGRVIPVELKGTSDNAEFGEVVDYKTISKVFQFDPETRKQKKRQFPEAGHVLQVNFYALLCEYNGIPVDSARIWYVQQGKYMPFKRMCKIDLMDLSDVYEIACQMAVPIAYHIADGVLPPPYEEGDPDFWKCRFCPVAEHCRRWADEGR